jgi:uncharacterized membrane protein YdjX (TVP38/TMEM64 family)
MRAKPSLEAIVLTTYEPGGWLEARTMGVGRQQFMASFADPSLSKRIQFVAPMSRCKSDEEDPETECIAPGGTLSIHVHAKVLIVDDKFLRIGSSNLNNRSMGFDTECDVAIEAANSTERKKIASIRNRLIAEHWGSDEEHVAKALSAEGCVADALAALPKVPVFSTAHGSRTARLKPWRKVARTPAFRRVKPLERDEPTGNELVVLLGDPERVVSTDELIAQATGGRRPLIKWALLALAAAAALALLAWGVNSLDLDFGGVVDRVVGGIEGLEGNPWRVPLVLVAFVIASVLAVPILALIGATVVALGPALGFLCSAVGTMLAASATFGIGRLVGRRPLQRLLGPKLEALEKRVTKGGVIAIALIRKVPIAPFTFVNMLIGAVGIRYRDFILGTALGMLPGIAAFSFVSDRAISAWREPTLQNVALIAAAVVVWLGVVFGIQHWLNRRTSR